MKYFHFLSPGSWALRLERRKLRLHIVLSRRKLILAQHNHFIRLRFNILVGIRAGTEHSVRDCYSNGEQRGAWTDKSYYFCPVWPESSAWTSHWIECFACGLKFVWIGMGPLSRGTSEDRGWLLGMILGLWLLGFDQKRFANSVTWKKYWKIWYSTFRSPQIRNECANWLNLRSSVWLAA